MFRRTAVALGKLFGIAGFLFVIYKLVHDYSLVDFLRTLGDSAAVFPLLLALNLLSTLLGIYAWGLLADHYREGRLGFSAAFYMFAKTEIAKYLPGNVFHLVGRQAIAERFGPSQPATATGSPLMSMLLAGATAVAAFLLLLPSLTARPVLLWASVAALAAGFLALKKLYPGMGYRFKLRVMGLFTLSLAVQGAMAGLIESHLNPALSPALFCAISGVYILSWLIGFVTPGASGGVGVREAAFLGIVHFFGLGVTTEEALFVILYIRIVNILVDLILYLATYAVGKQDAGGDAMHVRNPKEKGFNHEV